jgi:pimeloyl-ACP methyl ester carboxylesterase
VTEEESRHSLFTHLPPEEQRAQYAKLVHESGRAVLFELAQWYLDSRRTTAVDPAAITCPLLIVNGAEDGIIPIVVGRKIARRYPQADYRELPGHGHWVMGEPGWEAIARDVLGWLETKLPSAAHAT